MQKIVVVYRTPLALGSSTAELVRFVTAAIAPQCAGVTLHVKDADLPADIIASGSFDTSIAAGLTLWIDSPERLAALEPALQQIGKPEAVYSVVESTAREYRHIDWAIGTRSPGVTLFALLRRRGDLTLAEYQRRWYRHSGMSLRLHPLTRYLRNIVCEQLAGEPQGWDGIVEERVGTLADLAPERFYIGAGAQELAVRDLMEFVALPDGLRCGLLVEYLIKLPPWLA
jgi:hypothetical protein